MNELIRRALMGDQAAQQECTKKCIALPCPCCGKEANYVADENMVYHAYANCILGGRYVPLPQWNARTAPPIGRCRECKKLKRGGAGYGWCGSEPKQFDDFCSGFAPKVRGIDERGV